MTESLVVSISEAAELLGVSRPTIYRLLRRADFPSIRMGKRTIIPRAQLLSWLEEHSREGGDVL